MSVDRTVKALLAAILVALVALFVQNAYRDLEQPGKPLSTAPPTPAPAPVDSFAGEGPLISLQRAAAALSNPEYSPEVRSWAAGQVGLAQGPEALDALITALADDEIEVVRAAVEALAQRQDPGVREALVALRAHSDPWVSRRVGEVLAATR